ARSQRACSAWSAGATHPPPQASATGRRNVALVPGIERLERRMRQGTAQILPHSGHVAEVLRLVVAPVEPCENAENLGGALRSKRRVEACEGVRIEAGIGASPRRDITAEQR